MAKPKERYPDLEKQPYWIKHEPDSTYDLGDGDTAYLYKEKEIVIIAKEDVDDDGQNRPGKSVRLSWEQMDKLTTEYVKEIFGKDLELVVEEEEE